MAQKFQHLLLLISSAVSFIFCTGCRKEAELPALTTIEVSNIKVLSASAGGNVTDDGGAEIDLRGICWGTADNPTTADSRIYYRGATGSFTCPVNGLTPDTYYHVRAFATNRVGTAYGNEVHFTTLPFIEPGITTISVSFIRYTLAKANGNIEINDENLVIDMGFCVAASENPTIKDKVVHSKPVAGIFFCWLEDLQPGSVYHVRAYAVTHTGIIYGEDVSFNTRYPPAVSTAIKEYTETSATVEGSIIWPADSLGEISDWGVYYGIESDTAVNGLWCDVWDRFRKYSEFNPIKDGVFTFRLTELTPDAPYYVRAYITIRDNFGYRPNSGYTRYPQFTQYGNKITFTTSN